MNLSHKETVDVSIDQCIENTYQMNETFTEERTEKVKHPLIRFQDWLLFYFFKVHQKRSTKNDRTRIFYLGSEHAVQTQFSGRKWRRLVLMQQINLSLYCLIPLLLHHLKSHQILQVFFVSSSSAGNSESEDVTSDSLEFAKISSPLGIYFKILNKSNKKSDLNKEIDNRKYFKKMF